MSKIRNQDSRLITQGKANQDFTPYGHAFATLWNIQTLTITMPPCISHLKRIESLHNKTFMKRTLILVCLCAATIMGWAQNGHITGKVVDNETKDPLPQVTIQMLKAADSTFVGGVLTKDDGSFLIKPETNGKYILRFTSVGYLPEYKNVTLKDTANVDIGRVVMSTDAILLKSVTVTGQAAPVTVKEDTVIYNAAAYRTPEGSVVEELVKRLPGAEVSEDGTITINGKKVKKVKVDGKEFMTGDTQTAMKNLPTAIVDKVKTYDEKSDMARITGIDDDDESTVLDFGLKEGMHKGLFGNVDLGIGTKERYSEKLMGSYMNKDTRVMGFGSANNVGDRGFPGGGGGGRSGGSQNGQNAPKMAGINFNHESGQKKGGKGSALELDGSLLWNHNDANRRAITSVENFVATAGSFSNSLSQNYSRSNSIQGQVKMEWEPDTVWDVNIRANINYGDNDGRSTSQNASYNMDPYEQPGITDPLAQQEQLELIDSMMVNARKNNSVSYSDNFSANASMIVSRKLNSYGRNVSLRGEARFGNNDSKSLSENAAELYLVRNYLDTGDSTYITRRYNVTPTKNHNYSVQASYNEPITRKMFLQFSYQFQYSYNKSDRTTYDFSSNNKLMAGTIYGPYQTGSLLSGWDERYGGWDYYFKQLDNPLEYYESDSLSRFSEYKNYTHNIRLSLRIVQPKYRMTVGVLVQPQRTHFVQRYYGSDADTVRNVLNVAPTLNFRYRWNKQKQLRVDYRGSSSQPSMTDLLDITDDSDPLNVTKGNPGLKPSFTHRLNLRYNNFEQRHTRFVNANASWSATRNAISNMVTYNEQTGGTTTRPENINGNWDASANITYNQAVDSAGFWNISSATGYNYNHYVGYVTLSKKASSQRNTTHTNSLSERLLLTMRKDWFELTLDGACTYNHTRNLLQESGNLNTWQFSYGGSLYLYAPWGTSLSTDMHNQSRRGYSDATLNTNELIWNAQISQGFLKGKPLTVMIQFYDILHQMSSFSRTINAMRRSDTSYNNINAYAMLHVVYRLNIFGTREGRKGMGKWTEFDGTTKGKGNGKGMGRDGGSRRER